MLACVAPEQSPKLSPPLGFEGQGSGPEIKEQAYGRVDSSLLHPRRSMTALTHGIVPGDENIQREIWPWPSPVTWHITGDEAAVGGGHNAKCTPRRRSICGDNRQNPVLAVEICPIIAPNSTVLDNADGIV